MARKVRKTYLVKPSPGGRATLVDRETRKPVATIDSPSSYIAPRSRVSVAKGKATTAQLKGLKQRAARNEKIGSEIRVVLQTIDVSDDSSSEVVEKSRSRNVESAKKRTQSKSPTPLAKRGRGRPPGKSPVKLPKPEESEEEEDSEDETPVKRGRGRPPKTSQESQDSGSVVVMWKQSHSPHSSLSSERTSDSGSWDPTGNKEPKPFKRESAPQRVTPGRGAKVDKKSGKKRKYRYKHGHY